MRRRDSLFPVARKPKKVRIPREKRSVPAPSRAEELLAAQLTAAGIEHKRQYRLIPTRRFAWDFAFPGSKLLAEVQGGVWRAGAHSTGVGITRDCEKLSLAVAAGWSQLNATTAQVMDGSALEWIKAAIWERQSSSRDCQGDDLWGDYVK